MHGKISHTLAILGKAIVNFSNNVFRELSIADLFWQISNARNCLFLVRYESLLKIRMSISWVYPISSRSFKTLSEAASWVRYGFFEHVSVCAENAAVLQWFASNWRLFGTASTHLNLPSAGSNSVLRQLLECNLGGHIRIERARNAAKEQVCSA